MPLWAAIYTRNETKKECNKRAIIRNIYWLHNSVSMAAVSHKKSRHYQSVAFLCLVSGTLGRSDVRFASAKEPEDKARSKNATVILVATIERTNESRCSKRDLQDDVNDAVRDERRNRGKMLEAL